MKYKPIKIIKEKLLETDMYRDTTQKQKSYLPLPKPILWGRMAMLRAKEHERESNPPGKAVNYSRMGTKNLMFLRFP